MKINHTVSTRRMLRALLLLGLLLILSACREEILHNLNETEANRMMSRLVLRNLEARKVKQADGKWSLSLPEDQASEAIRYLVEQRLLKEEGSSLPEKSGLMMSREEQRFRYERSLSREIEATLSGIDGVLQARVHLNLPLIDPLFAQSMDNSKSSASVMLVLGGKSVDKAEVSTLVAGASGIPASAVSVMISSGTNASATVSSDIALAKAPSEFEIQQVTKEASRSTFSVVLQYARYSFAQMPWSWLGVAAGVTSILFGVIRLLNRPSKLAM